MTLHTPVAMRARARRRFVKRSASAAAAASTAAATTKVVTPSESVAPLAVIAPIVSEGPAVRAYRHAHGPVCSGLGLHRHVVIDDQTVLDAEIDEAS